MAHFHSQLEKSFRVCSLLLFMGKEHLLVLQDISSVSDLKGLDTADVNEFIQECGSDSKTKLSLGQKSKLRKMIKFVNEKPPETKTLTPSPPVLPIISPAPAPLPLVDPNWLEQEQLESGDGWGLRRQVGSQARSK